MSRRRIETASPWARAGRPERPEGLWGWAVRGLELVLALVCLTTGVGLKLGVHAHGPPWIEAGTGNSLHVAGNWTAFGERLWSTGGPPLYALLMHVWAGVFGMSSQSLQAPALIAAITAPFVVALVRTPGLSGSERLAWASVLGLWTPGVWLAHETRGYAVLILLSALQTIAFVRLMRHPTQGRAVAWALVAAAATLTHYHAGFLGLAQGAVLVAVYGGALAPFWPAWLIFGPVVAWIATHTPASVAVPRLDVAACPPLLAHLLEEALEAFVGGWPVLAGMGAVVVGGAVIERALRRRGASFSPGEGALWLATLTAVAAGGAVLWLGWIFASLTPRHLAVFAPGALLGLVLAARNLSDNGARTARTLLLAMALGGAWNLSRSDAGMGRGVCPPIAAARAAHSLSPLGSPR